MFRKKQTNNQPSRNVRQQQTANVFSYHASRSPGSGQQSRRMETEVAGRRKKKMSVKKLVSYAPSLIAGLILATCLVYISTLNDTPRLQVVGDQSDTGLVSGVESYKDGVSEVFNESTFNRSKLLIDTDEIARKLAEKYPELGEVAVILPLVGRRPVVQVRPAEPALVLSTLEGGLVVDENGRIIARAQDVESSMRDKLPVLRDDSGLSLDRGSYALHPEAVELIRTVSAHLKQNGYRVQTMTLPAVANEMHLRLQDKPYYVKFDLRGDGRVQAGTLIATKEKLEADKVTPREYVDVRVSGKAYYK